MSRGPEEEGNMTASQRAQGDHWSVDGGEVVLDGPVSAVEVRVPSGSITVAVTDGPPRVLVDDVRGGPVSIAHSGGALVVRHPGREGVDAVEEVLGSFLGAVGLGSSRRRASVTVLLPGPAPVTARSVGAEVMFSGVDEATADTVAGDVTVSRLRRSLRVAAVSGSVWAADVEGAVWVQTVSGSMTVARSRLDELRLRTVSGDAAVDGALHAGAHAFQSVSGDLALRADFPDGLALDAATMSGRVVCGVGDPEERSRPGGRRVTAAVGAGGARVTTHTLSGDVTLLSRSAPVGVA
jgi:hypothetical protein